MAAIWMPEMWSSLFYCLISYIYLLFWLYLSPNWPIPFFEQKRQRVKMHLIMHWPASNNAGGTIDALNGKVLACPVPALIWIAKSIIDSKSNSIIKTVEFLWLTEMFIEPLLGFRKSSCGWMWSMDEPAIKSWNIECWIKLTNKEAKIVTMKRKAAINNSPSRLNWTCRNQWLKQGDARDYQNHPLTCQINPKLTSTYITTQ